MVKTYHEQDADLHFLKEMTIGVIGYGNQGRASIVLEDKGEAHLASHSRVVE